MSRLLRLMGSFRVEFCHVSRTGDRNLLCEAPLGPFRQKVPVPSQLECKARTDHVPSGDASPHSSALPQVTPVVAYGGANGWRKPAGFPHAGTLARGWPDPFGEGVSKINHSFLAKPGSYFGHRCYACRVGKGTHRALDRCTHFARRYRYVLKCDVAKCQVSGKARSRRYCRRCGQSETGG